MDSFLLDIVLFLPSNVVSRQRSFAIKYVMYILQFSDSSENVCIQNCNISMGYNAIELKSGWDEYGIAYGLPTTNFHISGVLLRSSSGSGLALGSEMSGGITNILVEQLHLRDSFIGVELKTKKGREVVI